MQEKIKVLLVGETWFVLKMHIKGFDMVHLGGYEDFGVWFLKEMSRFEDIEIEHMPNHVALTSFPRTIEEMNKYDVVITSDCGKNTLQLYPEIFKVPMGPDRLETVREYVEKGKSYIMIGGWASFQGEKATAGYHGTPIEEILPVEISPNDDREEKPQGCTPSVIKESHPIFKNVDKKWPAFLGYNKVTAKKDADLLAEINGDPFIVTGNYGKGKTMAFTSDFSKHWGTAFIDWDSYGDFWHNVFMWLTGKI
ncbi:MAG: glutamine amidotransferase [Actinomycetota bacterium]|nr:glutamine amidotransferase [Actinomycetota bacterium]